MSQFCSFINRGLWWGTMISNYGCPSIKLWRSIYPGTYKTQELPCGIRVVGNPWPVKMAINITSSDWPQGGVFPGALKGQGLCDEAPWHMVLPCSASCMPRQLPKLKEIRKVVQKLSREQRAVAGWGWKAAVAYEPEQKYKVTPVYWIIVI